MKRAIALVLLTIVCILAYLAVKGNFPLTAVSGRSMEPALHSGSLLIVKSVNPADIKAGDIIIFNVPSAVRDYYNYPPVVSRRVIEVRNTPSLGFRTGGDNTGEDPFTFRPSDVRGTAGSQVPYLGLPLLFFQNPQSFILVIVALILLAVFLYTPELLRRSHLLRRGLLAGYFDAEKNTNLVLTQKIEATEKKLDTTDQALEKFSSAIAEYARHLASHTSAVKSLAEASDELKQGAAEQNRVLMALAQNLKIPASPATPATAAPAPAGNQSAAPQPAAPIKPQPQVRKDNIIAGRAASETFKPAPGSEGQSCPPGCARNRGELTREALAAEKEIYSALDRLHKKLQKPGSPP